MLTHRPINARTAESIRSKFCLGPHMTPGKVYVGVQEFFYFRSILKMRGKLLLNLRTFFVRRYPQIEPQLKVEKKPIAQFLLSLIFNILKVYKRIFCPCKINYLYITFLIHFYVNKQGCLSHFGV